MGSFFKMNTFKTFFIVFICLIACGSYANTVKSWSKESIIQTPDGTFSEVTITCKNKKRPIIQRTDEKSDWCSKEYPDVCSSSKIKVAIKACRPQSKKTAKKEPEKSQAKTTDTKKTADSPAPKKPPKPKLKKPSPPPKKAKASVPAPPKDALSIESDEISIEEERLLIEQKKLKLRQQELKLKRKELKLKQEKQSIE